MLKIGCLTMFGFCCVSIPLQLLAGPPALVVAHRGLLQHAPENTLSNFRACLELRLGFEFDVARTSDGHLVCIHDDTVDRTTNGTGRVAELTLEQIRELDAGSWLSAEFADEKVPTVEEVFQLIAEYPERRFLIAVDLKANDVEQDVVRLAVKHAVLDHLLFIGRTISEPLVRQRIRQASPTAQTAVVANTPDEFSEALQSSDASWVYFRFLPTKQQLDQVHAARKRAFIAGLSVAGHVPENWQKAVDAGMDGILTDYALELKNLLRQPAAAR